MITETFPASRWTQGNRLFPTEIEVTDNAVTQRKRSLFSRNEVSIPMMRVASVRIHSGLIWADLLIESTGGGDPLTSHGHPKADALRIKELIAQAQNGQARAPVPEG
ncbi:MAG: PH domain-containing protein [Holophaga sp.]|nr:PH domain-containing protein [Holophaga sp.]